MFNYTVRDMQNDSRSALNNALDYLVLNGFITLSDIDTLSMGSMTKYAVESGNVVYRLSVWNDSQFSYSTYDTSTGEASDYVKVDLNRRDVSYDEMFARYFEYGKEDDNSDGYNVEFEVS